jgi:TRAP-type mannitol/chloroaromatic compound transport system permease small subunit
MKEFPPQFYAVIRGIDRFSDFTGKAISLSMLYLVLTISYECFSRYLFNSPTVWVLESSYMTNGSAFMLGCAYALHKGAHVRTDMLWDKFSDRTKGMIDSLAALVLFLPTMAVLFYISIDDFIHAVSIDERSSSGAWTPIIWPLRGVVPLTAFMLFVQGISELLKSVWAWRTGEFLTKHEKIEV